MHIFVILNLGGLAGVLWFRITKPFGYILSGIVILITIIYPFIAFNPSSKLNIWIDEIAFKINLRSHIRKKNPRLAGSILLSVGMFDLVFFLYLYNFTSLTKLGYLIMLLGKIFKYLGFYYLQKGSKTIRGQNIWMYFMFLGLILYPTQIAYYFMSLLH